LSSDTAIQFASQHSDGFPRSLNQIGGSLLVSVRQPDSWVLLRADGDTINTHFLRMEKPTGAAFQNGRLALGTGPRVWEYRAMPMVAPKVEPANKHTNCYLPRRQHVTGDIDIHEMAFDGKGELWVVNTRMSCLCTLDAEHSVVPRWRPPFVSDYSLTDRCHLNGLAVRDGEPRYATALGETDNAAGWRENKVVGGLLMDVSDNRIISRGLSMPHSPRWHQDRLLLLESGDGNICRINEETGEKSVIVRLPGFTRGLDFAGHLAFIGLSKLRETSVFDGLPLTRREDDHKCGVWAVDTTNGQVLAFLEFTGAVREIFSVQLLPDRFPVLLEPEHPLVHTSYALPNRVLKDVVVLSPRQIQMEHALQAAAKQNFAGAAAILRELLGEDPDYAQAQLLLGVVLTDDEQWEEGLIALRRATELDSNNAEAHNYQGFAYSGLDQNEAALKSFGRAIELDSEYAQAHMNQGIVLLKKGKYAQGWKDFEYRWQTARFHPFNCPQPQWHGEDISGKTLLVHTEQGAGDAMMCARFLAQARVRCRKLILVAPENLRDLLSTARGVDEMRLPGNLPADLFDTYCPIMSLPGALGVELGNLPNDTPYLSVPEHISASCLKGVGLKVGFCWRGSVTMITNHHRSCELKDLSPLFELPGIDWFSFQMPICNEEAEFLEMRGVTNLEPELPGFARTAALASQLDQVISIDTSLVHLAGALGIPTWVILGHHTDWRWHTEDEESAWYPGMRLFRAKPGDTWPQRVERVRQSLTGLL
jgi:uncharacterized protein (TIGR03032 family)